MTDRSLESRFLDLIDRHGAAVSRVSRAYAFTEEDRSDLVQEIHLALWRALPRFRGDADPFTWFYRVALNTAIGWSRRYLRGRRRRCPLTAIDDRPSTDLDSMETTLRREAVDRLYAAIRSLSPDDAAVILLTLEDSTYRQISEILGISENHVGVKLHRAKQELRLLLSKETADGLS
ncbi:MAG: RNA polymerase sigma factor [Isosphaeraceae bacterium]|nr:RNA polymerase sigma factor [Isosphaeraceae bacterium]